MASQESVASEAGYAKFPETTHRKTSHIDVSGTQIGDQMLCAIPFHDHTSRVNQFLGPPQHWFKRPSTLVDFKKKTMQKLT
jgi:hypothetical protein